MFPYDYGYGSYTGLEANNLLGTVLAVVVVIYLVLAVVMVATYIFQALSFYTIAKRRGIRKPWLSWLPIGNMWILGSISDQYQYVTKGRVRNRRKILLVLTIAMLICPVFTGEGLLALLLMLPLLGICIAAFVIECMALYDLFRSCDPENGALYLALSIFISVLRPVFLFICRKKDLGMPPRRDAPPQLDEL